jgi:hypothetical protein
MKRQNGMTRSLVKSLVRFFAESYRSYAFGSFSKPTAREVERALAARRLIYTYDDDSGLASAAIFAVSRADSYQSDFSGRRCLIPRGSCYIRHLGATPENLDEAVPSLINQLRALSPKEQLWLEIHEENQALRECVERKLGFKYVMTKIKASSELRGVYLMQPETVRLPTLGDCEIPSIACLAADFLSSKEITAIRQELEHFTSLRPAWQQHYSHYNKRNSWTAFSLRGYRAGEPGFIIKPSEMSKGWKAENPDLLKATCADTLIAGYFPATMRVVARLPGRRERVRFMRLSPHRGELSRHADVTDREAGIRSGCVTRLHLPIATHEDVLFESWGLRGEHYRMHFAEGGLYYLDQRKPHRVVNRSPFERVHLVVDIYATAKIRELMP